VFAASDLIRLLEQGALAGVTSHERLPSLAELFSIVDAILDALRPRPGQRMRRRFRRLIRV
jgi:hypothetical protein